MPGPVLLGVCGWPVGHSRSPAMHNAALRAVGLHEWRYLLVPSPPERFAQTVSELASRGFRGLNVTIPHKTAALALADEATPAARAIGAANTLTLDPDGAVHADNTDAIGLLDALPPRHAPAGRRALVLGAGGAARAAAWALKEAGAADVAVWNRTPERAEALARELGVRAVPVPGAAEILVHCTSVGMEDPDETFKALPLQADSLGAGSLVVDMVYRPGGTRLLQVAQARGAEVVDGLGILVAQGAASFERWTGREAPREVMRAAVEDQAT
jgi:shikimate dehydrogenase